MEWAGPEGPQGPCHPVFSLLQGQGRLTGTEVSVAFFGVGKSGPVNTRQHVPPLPQFNEHWKGFPESGSNALEELCCCLGLLFFCVLREWGRKRVRVFQAL